MKFLGIGNYNSLGDMYLRLQNSGHEVLIYVAESEAHEIYNGMLNRTQRWQDAIPWIKASGGIVIIEATGFGDLAEELRADGIAVVGGTQYTDRLELDRAFGQAQMQQAGMRIASGFEFFSARDAIEFIQSHPKRYVYKVSDADSPSTRNYVGMLDDAADVLAVLEREAASTTAPSRFILMDHLHGVEVGIGAYFNGHAFLDQVCIDWEHKRFFNDDLGELTGEMGTVVSYRHSGALFRETLGRMTPQLTRTNFCGYININTIVNEHGVWPLEFTCRFGYPGFAICDALHTDGWGEIFEKMTSRSSLHFGTRDGFAVGVVLTVPPFPYEMGYEKLSKGAPIFLSPQMTPAQRDAVHFGEVEMRHGQLITSGSIGYVAVTTGTGAQVSTAQAAAYEVARQVVVPNVRYRTDIGAKLMRHDLDALKRWGWLD
jgi:phosphoribosylamine---glycine ligase